MRPLVPSLHPNDAVKLPIQRRKDSVCSRHKDRILYEHASVSVRRPSFASCISSATMALGTRPPVVLRSQGRGADPRNLCRVQRPGRPTRQTPNATFHGLHVGASLVLLEIPHTRTWQLASR
ncbi:unnamed protein product [Ixodes persulcatus]